MAPELGETAPGLSRALVDFYKSIYGRGPVEVKTVLSAELVVAVLHAVLAPGEKTLVAGGKLSQVEQMRLCTAEVARPRLIALVEEVLEVEVTASVTGIGVTEDVATETFLLASGTGFPPRSQPAVLSSVPLSAGEPAEGDQADQRHDQTDPEAPDEHQNDADDYEDSSK